MKTTTRIFLGWLAVLSMASLIGAGFVVGFAYMTAPTEAATQDPFTTFVAQGEPQVFSLALLKLELDADPKDLGYATASNFETAQLINTVGLSGEVVDVNSISPGDAQSTVVATEYALLTAGQRDLWRDVKQVDPIPIKDDEIRGQLMFVWGPGTTTRAALGGLQTKAASRAEALWGDGFTVSTDDVDLARRLP